MAEEAEVCTKISEKVKMAGFLEKKGSMLWKRYWFVLEDKLLLFYKSQLEYINLSPCRGSVNMGLVSTVQPRRNVREHIIHIVSRFNNLVLRAKDRATQEKWMQALLESIGKKGLTTLNISLEVLPLDSQPEENLPKRNYGGSLDTVWKHPVIPKTKMVDKVLTFEEDPDENQNIDLRNRRSLTLDRTAIETKMDSKFNKLRNRVTRKKSTATEIDKPMEKPEKPPKVRKDSFLKKMFRRTSSVTAPGTSSDDTPGIEDPGPENTEHEVTVTPVEVTEATRSGTPGTSVTDSDIDDPLYDKINPKDTTEKKQMKGRHILLPAGTLAELKDRLKSKEKIEKAVQEEEKQAEVEEPPALPPRHSGTFDNMVAVLDGSLQPAPESEESDLSGHYQVIQKPIINTEVVVNPLEIREDVSDDSETSGHYQRIRNRASETLQTVRNLFSSGPDATVQVPKNSSLLWPTMSAVPDETENDERKPDDVSDSKVIVNLEEDSQGKSGQSLPVVKLQPKPKARRLSKNEAQLKAEPKDKPEVEPEAEYQVVNLEMKKKNRQAKSEESKNNTPTNTHSKGVDFRETTPKGPVGVATAMLATLPVLTAAAGSLSTQPERDANEEIQQESSQTTGIANILSEQHEKAAAENEPVRSETTGIADILSEQHAAEEGPVRSEKTAIEDITLVQPGNELPVRSKTTAIANILSEQHEKAAPGNEPVRSETTGIADILSVQHEKAAAEEGPVRSEAKAVEDIMSVQPEDVLPVRSETTAIDYIRAVQPGNVLPVRSETTAIDDIMADQPGKVLPARSETTAIDQIMSVQPGNAADEARSDTAANNDILPAQPKTAAANDILLLQSAAAVVYSVKLDKPETAGVDFIETTAIDNKFSTQPEIDIVDDIQPETAGRAMLLPTEPEIIPTITVYPAHLENAASESLEQIIQSKIEKPTASSDLETLLQQEKAQLAKIPTAVDLVHMNQEEKLRLKEEDGRNEDTVKDKVKTETNEEDVGLAELTSLLDQLADMSAKPLAISGRKSPLHINDSTNNQKPSNRDISGLYQEPPPLSPKIKKKIEEDPDYDIPRPHVPNNEHITDDRITPTGFLSQPESGSTTSNSLEMDSLEDKKENSK